MKKLKKMIALTVILASFGSQIQAQDFQGEGYEDSRNASYLSAALPIGALAVAAILIATTNRGHHHGHGKHHHHHHHHSHGS